MLRMCEGCKDVLDTDQSISTKWGGNMGLPLAHFVLMEHTLVIIIVLCIAKFT